MNNNFVRSALVIGAVSLGLGACSVVPTELTKEELEHPVTQAAGPLVDNQEPVTGPIDVHEATARALLYNLDFKVEAADRAQRLETLELSEYAQWPQLLADAGYNVRDSFNASSSFNLTNGTQNFAASTSQNQHIGTANLGLSWNVLDFGLSYIRAQQNADRVMIAREEERKVVNRLVQDVRALYWRALSAQKQLPKLEALLSEVEIALEQNSQILEAKLAANPLDPLTYQRELLDIKRRAEGLIEELKPAKIQLSALINLKPGTEFSLADSVAKLPSTQLDISIEQLENIALRERPEMRTLSYEKRITAKEGRAQLLELLPGLRLSAGSHYSSNSFLLHQNWLDAGVQVSWNVFNLFRYPQTERTVEARNALLEAQQMSLTMAVITQVHVALARHGSSEQRYETAKRYGAIQQEISNKTEAAYETSQGSKHIRLREQINALVADIETDIAYADYQNAYAGVIASIGVDPLPEDLSEGGVEAIKSRIREHWHLLLGGELAKAYDYDSAAENDQYSIAKSNTATSPEIDLNAVPQLSPESVADAGGAELAPADIIAIDAELGELAAQTDAIGGYASSASGNSEPGNADVLEQPLAEQGIVVDLTPSEPGAVGTGDNLEQIPWTVQVASLTEEQRAVGILGRLKEIGIGGAQVSEVWNQGSQLFVVHVSYLTRPEAEQLKSTIESQLGINSWVRLSRI